MNYKQFKTAIRKRIGMVGIGEFVDDSVLYNTSNSWSELYSNPKFLKEYIAPDRLDFYLRLVEYLDTKIEMSRVKKVLDVGCGTGHLLLALHEKYPHIEFFGADFVQAGLEVASKVFPTAKFSFYDIYESKTEWEQQFDLVICTEVLEHLLYPQKAFKNLYSFVNPQGGTLVISVPDGRKDTYSGHIQFWSPESWAVFIEDNMANYPQAKIECGSMEIDRANFAIIGNKN